jgi:nucleoid-associated protein YgaU
MKDKMQRAANFLLTVVFAASLSGCASIIEYWSFTEEGAAASPAANGGVSSGVSAAAQESPGPHDSDETSKAEAALKKIEADLAAANQRIRELEAAAQTGLVANQAAEAARRKAEADAADQTASVETALKKAEADLAAANQRIRELEAAVQTGPAVNQAAAVQDQAAEAAGKKAETDAADAQKKAADAETARRKAEADLAASRRQAADTEAARRKAEADLAASRRQAADAEAARQQAAAEAAEAKERAEALNAQLASRAAEPVFPKYYTVDVWPPDCFWRIAELVYGDPYRWPILYEANRDKLEDPANPDRLERGTVLEIPSINGELREGNYTPNI